MAWRGPGSGSTEAPFLKYKAVANNTETTIWDPTSGYKFVLTGFIISTDTASNITIRDGTSGSTIFKFYVPDNGGAVVMNIDPAYISGTANNNLTLQSSAATNNTTITAIGYELV